MLSQVLEQNILEMLNTGEGTDVIAKTINGVSSNRNIPARISLNAKNDMSFDIVEEIYCVLDFSNGTQLVVIKVE